MSKLFPEKVTDEIINNVVFEKKKKFSDIMSYVIKCHQRGVPMRSINIPYLFDFITIIFALQLPKGDIQGRSYQYMLEYLLNMDINAGRKFK